MACRLPAEAGSASRSAPFRRATTACGVPAGGIDFRYGDAFPHEANMDKLHGVDFGKGCYVGQEVVRLSTTPVWEGGHLVPRPFVLRVFAAATPNGWHIMPGGFCRVSEREDVDPIELRLGIRSADVWVLSEEPVAAPLIGAQAAPRVRRVPPAAAGCCGFRSSESCCS